MCLICDPKDLRELQGKDLKCTVCLKMRSMSYYSVEMQKSALPKNYTSLRCKDCQFPKCSKCGQQPETALNSRHAPKTIEDVRAFKCTTC
eukprot:12426382-Karenia_brevis.AAC.1